MATTRAVFNALNAEFPSANFPQILTIHSTERITVLAFDASTVEGCRWRCIAPQGLTGTQAVVITYCMASATSNKVDFEVSVQAVTDNDALDIDTSTSFDSVNTITAPTVPGTAGYIDQVTCTLTNADSMAAGDWVVFKLERDADDGTNDTATGDAYVISVEWRDGV
jgi:hypothetical protein